MFRDAVVQSSVTEPDFYPAALERKPMYPAEEPLVQAMHYVNIQRHVASVIAATGISENVTVSWNTALSAQGAAGAVQHGSMKIQLSPELYKQLDPHHLVKVYTGVGLHEMSHILHSTEKIGTRSEAEYLYYNLLEDERIEDLFRRANPNFAYYMWALKKYLLEKSMKSVETIIKEGAPLETLLTTYVFMHIRCPHLQTEFDKTWEPIPGIVLFQELNSIMYATPQRINQTTVGVWARKIVELIQRILDESSASACTGAESEDGESDSGEADSASSDAGSASASGESSGSESGSDEGDASSDQGDTGDGDDTDSADEDDNDGESDETDDSVDAANDNIGGDAKKVTGKRNKHASTTKTLSRHADATVSSTYGRSTMRDGGELSRSDVRQLEEVVEAAQKALNHEQEVGEVGIETLRRLSDMLSADATEFAKPLDSKIATQITSIETTHMECYKAESDMSDLSDRDIIVRTPVSTPAGQQTYDRAIREHRGEIASMVSAFNVRQFHRDEMQTEQLRGSLSRRRIALGTSTSRIFERKHSYQAQGLDIALLIDESGSMCGRKINAARNVGIVLSEALNKVEGARLSVYGHSTSGFLGDERDSKCVINRYSIGGNLVPKLLGEIEDRWCNFDGWAIQHVGDELLTNKVQANKWLIVISDGMPSGAGYYDEEATQHSRRQVVKLERKGVRVLGVDIEGEDVHKIYTHYVKFTDMRTLVKDMRKLVAKALKAARSVEMEQG